MPGPQVHLLSGLHERAILLLLSSAPLRRDDGPREKTSLRGPIHAIQFGGEVFSELEVGRSPGIGPRILVPSVRVYSQRGASSATLPKHPLASLSCSTATPSSEICLDVRLANRGRPIVALSLGHLNSHIPP